MEGMAMENLLKDQYSIEEASDLLSQGDPNQKQSIRDHLGSIHAVEILKMLLDLWARDCLNYGWDMGLGFFTISREEVMRYAEDLKRNDKETSEEKQVEKPKYLFKKTDKGYLMVFDGEEIELSNQVGYDYLRFLMQHPDKEFTNMNLEQILKGTLVVDAIKHKKIDDKTVTDINEEIENLDYQIEEAEANNDGKLTYLIEKKEELVEYLREAKRMGKIKFLDDEKTKASERVSKAIFRAIEDLSKFDNIYNHFKQVFRPYAKNKKYRPSEPLPWIFE
jgi:hypothetical protein